MCMTMLATFSSRSEFTVCAVCKIKICHLQLLNGMTLINKVSPMMILTNAPPH